MEQDPTQPTQEDAAIQVANDFDTPSQKRPGLVATLTVLKGGELLLQKFASGKVKLHRWAEVGARQTWVFGRADSADFPISKKARLSKKHFELEYTGKGPGTTVTVRDLSTNGTCLNGRRLVRGKTALLKSGDIITVGLSPGVRSVDNPDETQLVFVLEKEDMEIEEGTFHAKYDISSEILGSGAFATVHKCVHRETGEVLAVKKIGKSKLKNNVAVQREISILREIKNPGVVQMKDHFEDSECHYLVMELMENGDLMDFVSEYGPIPEFVAREILKQVLEAVRDVHDLGISHRDIKPDNILIYQDDPVIVKVSDFGLAKLSQGSFLKTFCGTMAYIAPEILLAKEKRKVDKDSPQACYSNLVDMWSIGCLCYVLITGYLPFEGSTQEAMHRSIISGDYCVTPLEDHNISPICKDFIGCLLTVDVEERPNARQALRHPWFAETSLKCQQPVVASSDSNAIPASVQPSLAQEKFADIKRNTIIGSSSLPSLMEDRGSEKRSRDELSSATKQEYDDLDEEPQVRVRHEEMAEEDSEMSEPQVYAQDMPVNSSPAIGEQRNSVQGHSDERNGVQGTSEREGSFQWTRQSDDENQVWMTLTTLPGSRPADDLEMTEETCTVGRVADCNDIVLNLPPISKNHCVFQRVPCIDPKLAGFYQVYLHDKSRNGCWINSDPVGTGRTSQLKHGDEVYLFKDQSGETGAGCVGYRVNLTDPLHCYHSGTKRKPDTLESKQRQSSVRKL